MTYVLPSERPHPQLGRRKRPPAPAPRAINTRTPHGQKIADLVEAGYREHGFNVALRCTFFCGFLAFDDVAPIPEDAVSIIMGTRRESVALSRLRKAYGIPTIDSYWADFMETTGGTLASFRVIPDAWRVTAPEPGSLLMTAVEVSFANRMTEVKYGVYDDIHYYGFDNADFELEVIPVA